MSYTGRIQTGCYRNYVVRMKTMNDYMHFSPPSSDECEMARLLDLINAEWQSDPSSVACFDLRIVEDVRKALVSFNDKKSKADRELRRYRR